ncbi:type VI secretion system-associated protein TagF [Schauerella aestuarii]|uniref:type VI secretion system-associated protein TagF n=1 Tax=Schauerella aestuarii TaxID=2511204 RepID=UPI001369DB91|nr:type VI secretion system-associated protein TagF [Achromobacter aestuarii]MYZ41473.1 type VI secretion system-associated protein TagF [Achromobacter aestuarii]
MAPPSATAIEPFGWYGKIPAGGDFMHRRLPRDLIGWWDRWLQHGLNGLRHSPPEEGLRAFQSAPMWNFAIPSGLGAGRVQFGCISPSRDRVGRAYPVCAILQVANEDYEPGMLHRAARFYRAIGEGLLTAVRHGCSPEQLDQTLLQARGDMMHMLSAPRAPAMPLAGGGGGSDIMDILNSGMPVAAAAPVAQPVGLGWEDLADCFNPGSHTSYWWTNQADGAGLYTYLHGGALNVTLFSKLFASTAGLRR